MSFQESIRVMVGTKVQGCEDRFFGNVLCSNQFVFTLMIMLIMDPVFFMDRFLWYIIWNMVFVLDNHSRSDC